MTDQDAELSAQQVVGLQSETETAIKLMEAGLRELGRIDGANDYVHMHMLLLASGFERLLKLTVALHRLASTGQLPTSEDMRTAYGHDVRKLTDEFIRIASADQAYMARPACAEDIDFLTSDVTLQSVIDALAVFAKHGRYHDLNLLLEAEWRDDLDPRRVWDEIESRVLHRHPDYVSKLGTREFDGFYAVLARDLTYLIDRYAQAIVRLWTLGSLGRPAQMMLGMIKPFLFRRPEELGQVRR